MMLGWTQRLEILDFAFQPIVNIHTGIAYGYEALLRGYSKAGFSTIMEVFDTAHANGVLHSVDLVLRAKAVSKFTKAGLHECAHLFYNLDNRTLNSEDYRCGETHALLEANGLLNRLCFEISERHPLHYEQSLASLRRYREQGYSIAVDDYGTGFSGMQLLYYTEPDFIKIDRFFIRDIASDPKKKHFVAGLLANAHMLGSMVVAEGVETEKEFYECMAIGCDLVQGYLIQKPETEMSKLKREYGEVSALAKRNRREKVSDRSLITTEMEFVEPVRIDSPLFSVFQRFQQNERYTFFPVVNQLEEPVGMVREASFKKYAYSRFGRELLQNKSARVTIAKFIERLPKVDCHCPAERILDLFSLNKNVECILITDQGRYVGLLGARSLLRILYEKNLATARDQNPLTRLPGNNVVFEFVSAGIEATAPALSFVYLDFDKFKPYNDYYGFRQGDRVILRFAEILKGSAEADMIGHIGGDDFFLGYKDVAPDRVRALVEALQERFHKDVESFYEGPDLLRGYIVGKTRNGESTQVPIMRVSAGVLHLPSPRENLHQEIFGAALAMAKKCAKESETGYWEYCLQQ